jgi:hypothetical protein
MFGTFPYTLLLQMQQPINVPETGGPYYYRIRYNYTRDPLRPVDLSCPAAFCDSSTWRVQVVDSPVALIR